VMDCFSSKKVAGCMRTWCTVWKRLERQSVKTGEGAEHRWCIGYGYGYDIGGRCGVEKS
jgi:hypothetical protein